MEITNCARRSSRQVIFGQGFNSPQLHQWRSKRTHEDLRLQLLVRCAPASARREVKQAETKKPTRRPSVASVWASSMWLVYSSGQLSIVCAASWGSLASLAVRPAPKIRKATAHPGPASFPLLGFGDLPGALTVLQVSEIRRAPWRLCPRGRWRGSGKLQHTQGWRAACSWALEICRGAPDHAAGVGNPAGSLTSLTVWPAARIREAAEHPGPASCLLLRLRDPAGGSDRVAGAEDLEGCSTSRRASCLLLGLGDLSGALIELPARSIREGLHHIQGPRAASSWGSGDQPGALIELPVPRIRKAAAHPAGRVVCSWSCGDPPGCSDRAADAENHGRLQHTQGGELPTPGLWISARVLRVAGIEDPESSLVSLTMVPASRIREAAAHRRPVSLPLLGFGDLPGCSDRAADAQDPGSCSTPRTGKVSAPGLERSRRVP